MVDLGSAVVVGDQHYHQDYHQHYCIPCHRAEAKIAGNSSLPVSESFATMSASAAVVLAVAHGVAVVLRVTSFCSIKLLRNCGKKIQTAG